MPKRRPAFQSLDLNKASFCSNRVRVRQLSTEAGGGTHGISLTLKVDRAENIEEVGVCIPSAPMTTNNLRISESHFELMDWWHQNGSIVARNSGNLLGELGPLFLVVEKTETDQVSNCYYKGRDQSTQLLVSGNWLSQAQLKISAGFSCQETGDFGFQHWLPQVGRRFSIFLKTKKLRSNLAANWKSYFKAIW